MSTMSKKRGADQLETDDMDLLSRISQLEQENDKLKSENLALKEKLLEYEESDDDDDEDDEESVCDGSFFSKKYFRLKHYKQQHGDCKVPYSNKELGVWVNNVKANRRKNKLSQDRIDKLNKIGFDWGKGFDKPVTWDDRFQELKTYHAKFHHCNIHIDANPARQSELAKWVLEQRKQGKRLQKMKPSCLTMAQYDLLDALGFKWKAPKSRVQLNKDDSIFRNGEIAWK